MSTYQLTCCSTADLDLETFEKLDLKYVPFTFHLDGKDYFDDYGNSMPIKAFYDAMRSGSSPTTSQVSVGRYLDFWRPFLENGQSVLHLTLSSGISGSYNSALLAAQDINAEFKDVKVVVIDSLCASSGYGLLMSELAQKRDEGLSFEEICDYAKDLRLKIQHWFFPSELTYLVRGGRVSKTSGFIGGALHICPLMNVDYKGHLIPRQKIRGKKKVMAAQIEMMKAHALNGTDYNGRVYICNSDCLEDAEYLKKAVFDNFPKVKSVEIFSIGTVIGAHTGPGTLGLFFVGDQRVD